MGYPKRSTGLYVNERHDVTWWALIDANSRMFRLSVGQSCFSSFPFRGITLRFVTSRYSLMRESRTIFLWIGNSQCGSRDSGFTSERVISRALIQTTVGLGPKVRMRMEKIASSGRSTRVMRANHKGHSVLVHSLYDESPELQG